MWNATVIDFETADQSRSSPCEVGIATIKNGQLAEVESYLIKPACYPSFYHFCVRIHGIRPADVEYAPEWPEVWSLIQPKIENQIVLAHSAGFDMSVLRATHALYNLSPPSFSYGCTEKLARNIWPHEMGYRLENLCISKNIRPGGHRAGADAKATAELLILMAETIGGSFASHYIPLFLKPFDPSISKAQSDPNPRDVFVRLGDQQHEISELAGKTIVFTGAMHLERRDMEAMAIKSGAIPLSSVTKKTDILVVGQQDIRVVGEDQMSSKQEKALKMRQEGHHIEVISEMDFLRLLKN